MKTKQFFWGAILAGLMFWPLASDPSLIAQSTNRFNSDLYAQLKNESGNSLFSAYSIYTALAMPYAGARGSTEKEMSNVLHITLPQNQFHQANAQLAKTLAQKSNSCELSIANKIFIRRNFSVLPQFTTIMNSNYGAAFESVDFEKQEASANRINSWVARETKEKIQKIILPSYLSSATAMVLVNAIYFKGKWERPFAKASTHQAPFCLNKESYTDVDMMMQTNTFNYMENELLQLIELPYKDSSLSMYVLLPKELDGLEQIETIFTPAKFAEWASKLEQKEVVVKLPKFKIETEYMLADTLANMGMTSAFACADFSGIANDNALAISKIVHKAYLEVEEEGAEAAAATAVIMGRSFCRLPQEIIFNADHPFIFLIRNTNANVTLFMGKFVQGLRTQKGAPAWAD